MFDFLRRSGMQCPSGAVFRALEAQGLPPGTDISALGVVRSLGRFAGRKVTYLRVYDPRRAATRVANVFTKFTYQDLDAHPYLVLRAGFIEQDGTVVTYAQSPALDAAVPLREPADRAAHAEDERPVLAGQGPRRLMEA